VSDSSEEVLSVGELDRRLKRAVELGSAGVWVEGEIASFKPAVSGHVYFTLKDERDDAVIECVMYKFEAQRARRVLSEGARIQLRGKATVWAPRGRLQFVGDRARPAGRGAILEALEALRLKLDAEGLFSAEHKRELPPDPRIVGVVTSKAGAAFSDIRTVAFRRGSVRLVLANARVQGEGAAESILAAIDAIERYPGLDVLIVGRGGGSGEDLMAFNDERVVRRVAASKVPVVSAVGHEIDLSLTDLAADVRAATPSQAAELVVPDARQRLDRLARCKLELGRSLRARLSLAQNQLSRLEHAIEDPRFLIAERQQELDELDARLGRRLQRSLAAYGTQLGGLERRLFARHPRAVLAHTSVELRLLKVRLGVEFRRGLRERRAAVADAAGRLDALSPLAVLSRGYAIASTRDGQAVRDAATLRPGETIAVRVAKGRLEAEITRVLAAETDEGTS
jgi:exodeoxyribonuclease VII large subunit